MMFDRTSGALAVDLTERLSAVAPGTTERVRTRFRRTSGQAPAS
jgi:hypothetical protein